MSSPEKSSGVDESYSEEINQELYKKNSELAIKNKTLSLLRKLYEIGTYNLDPDKLSHEFVESILQSIKAEMVSVFLNHDDKKLLFPLATSLSPRFSKLLGSFEVKAIQIPFTEKENICVSAIETGTSRRTDQLSGLLSPIISSADVERLSATFHNIICLAYPLLIDSRVRGVLVLVVGGEYEKMSTFEREKIDSLSNVVAVALDKAIIYQELKTANDKLQELDKAKSEFMSIASHQLRTPLAGIIGYLDMMYAGDFGELKEEQKPIVHDVLDASQRLTRLVNTFLNVTRIEAGRFTINYATIPFHDLIDSMVKQLKPTADKKKLILNYTKSELPTVEVDIDKMKDVVGNLIDNAIKYTPEGSITVTGEAKGSVVHFAVKDTGVGIPAGEDKQLFNKFVRGEGIAQINPNGSGLGLFIAKKVVEGHKGKIWAESKGTGKGTTFHVEIPIAADPEVKKKAEEFAAKGTPTNTSPDIVPAPEQTTEPEQPAKPKKSTKPRTRKPRKQK